MNNHRRDAPMVSAGPQPGPTPGMMMGTPLTTGVLLRRLGEACRDSRLVSLADEGESNTATTAENMASRARLLAAGLAQLGVGRGDRVATLAWNTQEHVEAYWGVTAMGAVLHTVNLRLFPEQIVYTITHANDRMLIVDRALVETIAPILDRLPCLEHVIVVGDMAGLPPGSARWTNYEELLERGRGIDYSWPDLDENDGAALCYTSGTTGHPKGILYSHRSVVLHALTMSTTGGFRISREDRVLALVPLFHALGWGLPFVAAVVGCDLVLPGKNVSPSAIARAVAEERVTWAGGVPTLWMDLAKLATEAESRGEILDLGSLRTILAGGTKVPVPLMRQYHERWGIDLVQGWGMTETLPGATLNMADAAGQPDWTRRGLAGQASPLYEFRVVGPDGSVLPADGRSLGEIEVRGPIVASGYLGEGTSESKFDDGWLRTGDVGTLDAQGWVEISDRAKDVIKSGGEWISSQDLEAAFLAHPSVHDAAVVAVPDERWSERPLAFVVTSPPVGEEEIRVHLAALVAKWWIPERIVFVDAIPRNSTGKADKAALRGRLHTRESADA